MQSGPGAARAAGAARRAIDAGAGLLVSWGLAGGLGVLLIGNALRVPGRHSPLLDVWLFHAVIAVAVVLAALRPLLRRGDRLAGPTRVEGA